MVRRQPCRSMATRSTDIVSGIVRTRPVAANRRGKRKADAGVAAHRLDEHSSRPETPLTFRVLDQRDADPILEAPTWVVHLALGARAREGPSTRGRARPCALYPRWR